MYINNYLTQIKNLLELMPRYIYILGCTDSALGPAHPRPTRRDAGTRQGRRRPRVPAASDRVVPRGKARIGPTRADAAEVGADSAEIGADAAKIGPTRPVSAVSACIGRNGRVRPKKKKNGANAPFY